MKYRIFILNGLDVAVEGGPRAYTDHIDSIRKTLSENPLARCINFECEERDLGAYVRATLWVHNVPFNLLTSRASICLVQKQTGAFTWETVSNGDYDCAGLSISFGR